MNDPQACPGLAIARRDAVLEIVLDRPHDGNLVSNAMSAAIVAALASIDDEVKLVRFGARGADFCAGRESPMPAKDARPSAHQLHRVVTQPPVALYDALKNAPVPVLAVVRGRAVGTGCAIVGACDLALCADDARFSVPELARDIPPTLVMAALLGRVPPKAVAQLVLSRDEIDASAALRAGLASAVVPAAALDAEADRLERTLLGCSAVSLRAVKEFLRLAPSSPPAATSVLAAQLGANALSARF